MGELIPLIVVILTSSGFIYYRLGKLVEKVKDQGEDIKQLQQLVINGNNRKKPKRRE